MKKINRIFCIIGLTLLIVFNQSTKDGINHIKPIIVKKTVDLSAWDFAEHGIAVLNGEKETRHLVIKLNDGKKYLGIKIKNLIGVEGIYFNNKLINIGETVPYIDFFEMDEEKLEIIFKLPDEDYLNKAFRPIIYLGLQKDILQMDRKAYSLDLVVVIGILFIALHYLCIYLIRVKDKSILLSGVLFAVMGIHMLFSGENIILGLGANLSVAAIYKIQYFSGVSNFVMMLVWINSVGKSSELSIGTVGKRTVALVLIITLGILSTPYPFYMNYTDFVLVCLIGITISIFVRAVYVYIKAEKVISYEFIILTVGIGAMLSSLLLRTGYINTYTVPTVFNMIYLLSVILVGSSKCNRFYKYIEKTSHELVQMDYIRDDFLMQTSHELRTPLKGIASVVQFMLGKESTNLTASQKQQLELIHTILGRLNYLISDIEDLARLKNGQMQVDIGLVDMKANIELIRRVYEIEFQEKGIKFELVLRPCWVYGDENRIRQVLYNLVENALQNTSKGSVRMSAVRCKEQLIICVQDTGKGMTADRKKMVQDIINSKEETYSQLEYGAGIGLKISASLLKLMNGELRLDYSEPEKGTRFSFALPYADRMKQEDYLAGETTTDIINLSEMVKKEEEQSDGSHQILIITDTYQNKHILKNALDAKGYYVLQAYTEVDIMHFISSLKIDILILDIMPPAENGLEICHNIRKKYSSGELPILMTIPEKSSRIISLVFEAGANDFVMRPYEMDVVITRVENLISIKDTFQEALKNELAFLQAQIKPHFLYNVMNTIVSLCYSDSVKAAQLLLDLSKYLRLSFDINWSEMLIPLSRELQLIQAYVRIEKARFGERIQFYYKGDEQLNSYKIPALMIQPLVENAIRHGICKKEEGGQVILTIYQSQTHINIQIEDNGVGISEEQLTMIENNGLPHQGIGLLNIRKRLALYKHTKIEFESQEGEGTRIFIQLPFTLMGKWDTKDVK